MVSHPLAGKPLFSFFLQLLNHPLWKINADPALVLPLSLDIGTITEHLGALSPVAYYSYIKASVLHACHR
jgi:hypothetical protein